MGLGIPCLMCIQSLLAGRGIPLVFGFPAYGGGPFEQNGVRTTIPIVVGFLVVGLLEGLAGWLLWTGRVAGGILALALLPFGAVYWWGFALPYPPLAAIVTTVLIVLRWKSLR